MNDTSIENASRSWIPSDHTQWLNLVRELVAGRGCQVEVLVVDSYHVSNEFFESVRPCARILVQLADFDHYSPLSDIVVHPTDLLKPCSTRNVELLAGPEYALLRDEFTAVAERRLPPQVGRILLTLGGGAQLALIERVLQVVDWALGDVIEHNRRSLESRGQPEVRVVLGPFSEQAPPREISTRWCSVRFLREPNMVREMLGADLAVSAGGQTLFELAATGTPTIAIQIADNQAWNIQFLLRKQVISFGGIVNTPGWEIRCRRSIVELVTDYDRRLAMSQLGRKIIDGRGAWRVSESIIQRLTGGHHNSKRPPLDA